jgi:hypothetical protein
LVALAGRLTAPDATWPAERSGGSCRPPDAAEVPLLQPSEAEVSLDEPLRVRSGEHATATLRLVNHGQKELAVKTTGVLLARIVDPADGTLLGGYRGAISVPLVVFRAPPGAAIEIPLLVGTSSSRPELGGHIPPGEWATDVILEIEAQGRRRTPLLPVVVTS